MLKLLVSITMLLLGACAHQQQSPQFYTARAECSAIAGNAGGVTHIGRTGLSMMAFGDCMRGKGY